MNAAMQQARLWLRYRMFYPFLALLPASIGYRLARHAGRLAARLDEQRLALADASLSAVMPAMSPAQRRATLLAQQGMLAREVLDVYRLRKLTPQSLPRLIRLEGMEHLRAAQASGRPVILYSAHFGRLIMPAMALGVMGVKTSCLTADITHPRVPTPERRYLGFKLAEMQRLMGGDMIQRGDPLRRLYRVLHEHGVLIVILDAPPAKDDAVARFPFLGGTARLSVGTLRLARRTGAVLIPYFALERDGMIEGRFLEALDLTGLDDAAALTRLFAPIEQQIRRHPDHWWLWQMSNAIRQPAPVARNGEPDAPKLA